MQSNWMVVIGWVTLTMLTGCGDKLEPSALVCDNVGDIGFEADVKPLVEAECTACHSENAKGSARFGAPAGVDFDTAAASQASADEAMTWILNGTMPPSQPLSDDDACLFKGWIDGGFLP